VENVRMSELPTGTVTLLFSDVEGSTRHLLTLGPQYEQALADHRRLLRDAFARAGGREVNTQGDSFLVAFTGARDALAAAVDGQRSLAAHTWPGDRPLRVRMGIHTGEPVVREGDYVGLDVHRAARISAAAHGGQVLVSAATRQLLGDEPLPDVRLQDLGEHLLKDLPAPERIFTLQAPELQTEFPPPRALDATALPVKASSLVGRAREVETLVELIARDDVRLVTCTGAGGIGKTRLALQVAAGAAPTFRSGVVLVALAPVTDAVAVLPTIAASIGVRPTGRHELEGDLAAQLAGRPTLFVLDNFEQVSEAAPDVARLLERAPDVKVLATSRAALRVSGEHEFPVPPMPPEDAVSLFAQRATAVRPGFVLTESGEPAAAEICRRLDGLPLAIELAAARTRLLGVEELLARLTKGLDVLGEGPRDLPGRQRTLRATLDWSWDLLGPDEQKLFGEVAIFVGGATIEAIEAVCLCDDALRFVEGLVDNNLLQRTEGSPETRVALLETVREYALGRLDQRRDAVEIRRRHARWFADLARRAEPELTGEHQAEWLHRLARDHDNLHAALDFLLASGNAEEALGTGNALMRYWRARGHAVEARRWLDSALDRADEVDPRVRAGALWTAGRLAMAQSDLSAAERRYTEAKKLYASLENRRGESFTVAELGMVAFTRGDLDRAEALSEKSLELAREVGDDRAASAVLTNLAGIVSARADHERARALYEESLELRRRLGDPLLIANTLHNLSLDALAEHDVDRARAAAEECLAISRELGNLMHSAGALYCLGKAALIESDWPTADEYLRQGLELYDRLHENTGIGDCLKAMAEVAAAQEQPERAARIWGAVEGLGLGVPHEDDPDARAAFLSKGAVELGEDGFESARAAGRRLTLEAAVAEALADEGVWSAIRS
jgi:predicted ATPase/class 3 adenylate cyclase